MLVGFGVVLGLGGLPPPPPPPPLQCSVEVPHQPNWEQHVPSAQTPSPRLPPPHVPAGVGLGGLMVGEGGEGGGGDPPEQLLAILTSAQFQN